MSALSKKITSILFFLLFISLPHISIAQKILGGEITYQRVNYDSIRVNISAYLFCDTSAKKFSPGKLLVTPVTGSAFTVNLVLDSTSITDVSPVSDKTCTPCNTNSCGNNYGVQKQVYEAYVSLGSYTDCNFTLSWQAKNRKINGENLYLEATVNKCFTLSSPIYTKEPVFLSCLNTCNSISFGAISTNYLQDSLSYAVISARKAKDTVYSYPTGYSSANPMSLSTAASDYPCNGFAFDVETGFANFKPTKEEDAVISIKTIQWLKDSTGVYRQVGSIMQDLQLTVLDCGSNKLPEISGINGGNQNTLEFCATQAKCFTINTYDRDTLTDTVTLTSNISQAIPGASISIEAGKKFPKATICWTPYHSDVQAKAYNLTIYAADNHAPVNGRAQRIISIKVNPAPEASYTAKIGACGEVTFTSFPGKTTAIAKYEWSGINGSGPFNVSGNPVKVKYARPSSDRHSSAFIYRLTLTSIYGCKTIYHDSIKLPDNYLWVDLPKNYSVCANSTINIEATPHNGKPDVLYNWSTDSYGVWTKNKVKLSSVKIIKDTTFWVTIKDATGCINSDTIRIKAQNPPKPNLGPDRRECNIGGQVIKLTNSDTITKPKSINWFKVEANGGNTLLSNSPLLQVKDSGKYWILVTDSVGCTGVDSINIFLNPKIDVERKTVKACHGDSVTITGGTTSNGASWAWEDIRFIHLGLPPISTEPNIKLLAKGNGQYFKINYKVTVVQQLNGLTCKDVDTITLEIYPLPAVEAGTLMAQCPDNLQYNLNQVVSSPTGGWWTYSKKSNDVIPSNVVSPRKLGPGDHYLYYWYKDAVTECPGYDSSLLRVDSLPNVKAGNDTAVCKESSSFSLSGSPANGIWEILPVGSKGLIDDRAGTFDPAEADTGTVSLIYRYTNKTSARCTYQDTVIITVYPTLEPDGGNYAVQCNSAADLALGGTPANGVWNSHKNGLISKDSAGKYHFSPYLAGYGKHKIWYTASYAQGACAKTDTIFILVDSNCVWPGDANLDKTADYLDILDIALGYTSTGIPRINATTNWVPQVSKDWNNSLLSGINYKHLDTNGDSIINSNDTLAVAANYGKTHLKNEEPQLTGNPNDPPLYFRFNKKYYIAGDTVKAALYLGDEDKPVKDVYGLGLKHFFANPYMETGTYNFTWNCEMLCGILDNLQIYRQFNDKGTGEGSLIRTDKMTTSKLFGKVADIEFILKDSTFSYPQTGTNISLEILKSRLIDMNGNEIPVYTEANAVKVYRSQKDVVGIHENKGVNKAVITIYPNPAKDLVYIEASGQMFNEISILNVLGETVLKHTQTTANTSLHVAHLKAGIYFIRVKTGNHFSQHKLVIAR